MRVQSTAACCLLISLCPAGTPAAVIDAATVVVRVYDAAGVNAQVMARALATAAPSLSSATIDVAWRICTGPDVPAACRTPLGPGELMVRLVHGGAARSTARLPLGDALVDARDGGVLATIYVDRVEWLAGAARADAATLLGRAIAHELGHLLLASSLHSKYGLMRSTWSREEVRDGRRSNWTFTPQDARMILARLAARAEPNIVWGTE